MKSADFSHQQSADSRRPLAISGWGTAIRYQLSAVSQKLSAAKKHLTTILFRRKAQAQNNPTTDVTTADDEALSAESRLLHAPLQADPRPLTALFLKADSRWLIAPRALRLAGACLVALLLMGGAGAWGDGSTAQCAGLCQGCYCDQILNGTCIVNGRPSSCIGCVGSCIQPNECQCGAGVGGCGAVVAWCRSSDCQPREEPTATPVVTPTPLPTPTPPPPLCQERVYLFLQPPQVVDWFHRPDYPTVVGQDATFRGFDLVIAAAGGFAETRQVVLEQLCPDGGSDPSACPATWRWQCSEKVLAHYDDPLVAVDLPMRLADSSMAWLGGELPQRYYQASPKEGLPKSFVLWRGEAMSVQTGLFDYKAQDPGVHGGQILVTTKGTPLHPPQRIAQPYAVKVHLLDTTLDK